MNLSPMLLADFYKLSHRRLYPNKTEMVYSTWTARTSRMTKVEKVVAFGFQAFLQKYLIDYFEENFFSRPLSEVLHEYTRIVKYTLGDQNPDTTHIEELHQLGYLPLHIKAVPEGTAVPLRVPMLTVYNTDDRFYWLTNYIETLASCEMWLPSTSATIANEYRKLLEKYALETAGDAGFVQFQGHDFSMRGMSCVESAVSSGMGHLLSFAGTDTIPAISGAEYYYNADVETELVGTSVPATEHSVMCAYGQDEVAAYKRIITEVHPTGIVSIVSDTWDLWTVVGKVLPALKTEILARKGGPVGDKVVIRPDSGDPVKIVCGDANGVTELERKGLIEALWDIFGGTTTAQGYKVLDPHIGAIYGDAITLERCEQICEGLKQKGFASTNMVYGIGSYTYQYNTRDTFGFALKSTLCVINGDEKQIFKDPKTDSGIKKSQKGAVAVFYNSDGNLTYRDELFFNQSLQEDILQSIFYNGEIENTQTFAEIRARLRKQ